MFNSYLSRVTSFALLILLLPWSSVTLAYSVSGNASARFGVSAPVIDSFNGVTGAESVTVEKINTLGGATSTASSQLDANLGVNTLVYTGPGAQFLGNASVGSLNSLILPSPTGSSETTIDVVVPMRISGELNINPEASDPQYAQVTASASISAGFLVDLDQITLQASFDGDPRRVLWLSPAEVLVELAEDDELRSGICDDPTTTDPSCFMDSGLSFISRPEDGFFEVNFVFESSDANPENELVFDLYIPGVFELDRQVLFSSNLAVNADVFSDSCDECPFAEAIFGSGFSYSMSTGSTSVIPDWSSEDTVGTPQIAPLASVPVPPAVWLFGSGLLGLVGIARRRKKTTSSLQQQKPRSSYFPLHRIFHRQR